MKEAKKLVVLKIRRHEERGWSEVLRCGKVIVDSE